MIRDPQIHEVDALAELWHSGWQDAHAGIVPAELARHRTLDNFRERMRAHLAEVRVAARDGVVLGFTLLEADELNQFYVAAGARGTGLAAELMRDAEQCLNARGVTTAWLACAIGNERAARFYAKCGWTHTRNAMLDLRMPDGSVLPLEVWRFEKELR